jgi:hypothetical protein
MSAPEEEWNKSFGSDSDIRGTSVEQTRDGGYIIVGVGFEDVKLFKIDSSGNEQWSKYIGRTVYDDRNYYSDTENRFSARQLIDNGYIIIGTIEHDDHYSDVWLIKTDSEGNKQWDKTFDVSGYDDYGYSVQQTEDKGYIITGYTESRAFLIKTDSSGNKEWIQTFDAGGDWGYVLGRSVQQTNDGGYVIAGKVGGKYTDTAWVYSVWLLKTDPYGNIQWEKTFGGRSGGRSVQQTGDGGYIVVGDYIVKGGYSDIWLIKTNPSGNEQWDILFGGQDDDRGYSVQQTTDNGYILTGYAEPHGSYDSQSGVNYAWLIRTDPYGNMQWNKTFGNYENDKGYKIVIEGRSVQQTSDGGYIVTGTTYPYGLFEDYRNNIWLIKLEGTGEVSGTKKPVAPDIEKPPEKSISWFGAFGVMSVVFAVFLLMRRRV